MANPLTDAGSPFSRYGYYYELTVPPCAAGDEIGCTLDNLATTPGLTSWGFVRDDLNDLRVAYWNGTTWTEIGRHVSDSLITFAARTTHASRTVGTYCVVIGHASEFTTPISYTRATRAPGARKIATREAAKRHRATAESRTIDSEVTTGDGSTNCYGVADATGAQVAARFVPSVTGDYQWFELLVRRDATHATSTDCYVEIWSDSSGSPGSVIGRGVSWVYGIESSDHAFSWLPFHIPSTLTLSGGTAYWCVFYMPSENLGSDRGTNWAWVSVARGGAYATRTRSSSSWGRWSTDETRSPCLKVYRGRPGLPSRRITFGARGSSVLAATGGPSWEARVPAQNVAVANISSAHWDGAEWRVTYSAYSADSAWLGSGPGAYLAMRTGAAHGHSITSLTKYDQDPLIAPMPNETGAGGLTTAHTYVHTFNVYDWTAGSCKAYYRDCSVRDADRSQENADSSGRVRRLIHATNTHANWSQPSTSGGWANDGVVTFPCPMLVNVFEPSGWIDGATTHVSFGVYNSTPDKARLLRGTKMGTTTVGSLTPILFDLSDMMPVATADEGDVFFVNLGRPHKTTDGVWHTPCYLQRHTTHDNGAYYYDIWMMESLDGLIYAPAYPLVLRDAGVTGEELGAVPLGFAGAANLLVGRIARYFAHASPYYASDTASHNVSILVSG